MKLNFSYGLIDALWLEGVRPFTSQPTDKIKVHFGSLTAPPDFPKNTHNIGTLLSTWLDKPTQSFYVTLLLSHPFGSVQGDIWIQLPLEAIKKIRMVSAEKFHYELTLESVELTDVTPTNQKQFSSPTSTHSETKPTNEKPEEQIGVVEELEEQKQAREERHAACHDGLKLQFDLFKHLTTLSSGSILFMAAFLGKLGENTVWRPLVATSYLCFLITTGLAVLTMFCIVRTIRRNVDFAKVEEKPSDIDGHILKWGFKIVVIAFFLGAFSLALFGWKNIWG